MNFFFQLQICSVHGRIIIVSYLNFDSKKHQFVKNVCIGICKGIIYSFEFGFFEKYKKEYFQSDFNCLSELLKS